MGPSAAVPWSVVVCVPFPFGCSSRPRGFSDQAAMGTVEKLEIVWDGRVDRECARAQTPVFIGRGASKLASKR